LCLYLTLGGAGKIIGYGDNEPGKDNIVHASLSALNVALILGRCAILDVICAQHFHNLKHFWLKLWLPHGGCTIKNYLLDRNMVGNKSIMNNK
jgi:hypothetical protein